jgi:hypothetical protein
MMYVLAQVQETAPVIQVLSAVTKGDQVLDHAQMALVFAAYLRYQYATHQQVKI